MAYKKTTQEIIDYLISGKTQWEVHRLGYPFGTVRYHYQRLFRQKQFKRFMIGHKERVKARWEKTREKEASGAEIKAKKKDLKKAIVIHKKKHAVK